MNEIYVLPEYQSGFSRDTKEKTDIGNYRYDRKEYHARDYTEEVKGHQYECMSQSKRLHREEKAK